MEIPGNPSAVTTLENYAAHRFPEHRIEVRTPSVSLTDYTVVAQINDADAAPGVVDRLQVELRSAQIGLAFVLPNESPVVATEKEDSEGPIDLSWKRVVTVALILAVVVGAAGLFITRAVIGDWTGAIIAAVFLAIVGAVVGALLGGAGRYAGDRAWQQQRQGDNAFALVAVCLNDEATATSAATTLEGLGLTDVRIVGQDGAWHLAST